jgi:hypothetical protein
LGTINVMLNYLGTPVSKEYLDCLYDGKNHSGDIEHKMMKAVLQFPPDELPREVLERYVKVSEKGPYIPIFPFTEKLFERFLVPLKSAKRLYCLGEFLAAIELSAHLGEMLALLLWQITPTVLNGKQIDEEKEKALWGRTFEKMGQEKRINLLDAFGVLAVSDKKLFDFLRETRRKYFHFWSATTEKIESDALQSFLKISSLVQSILKIKYKDGAVIINPLLEAYLAAHKQSSTTKS